MNSMPQLTPSPISSLVLVGGKSARMGSPKALIQYHGKAQGIYLWEQLSVLGLDPFVSIGQGGVADAFRHLPSVSDLIPGLGPLGAIYSAQMFTPQRTWLVVACDMPNVKRNDFEVLVQIRKPELDVSLYVNEATGRLEPLLSIWEPSSFPKVKTAIEQRTLSIHQLMDQLDVHKEVHPQPDLFLNVNSPADYEAFMKSKDGAY